MTNTCSTYVEITMAYLPCSPAQSLTDQIRLSQSHVHKLLGSFHFVRYL